MARSFKKRSILREIGRYRYIYILLIPGLIYFFVFKYMPMYGVILAFKDYSPSQGILGSDWVGLEHFRSLMIEPEFKTAFLNTLIISFMKILIGFPFPIILSLLINELRMRKLKRTLQTVYTFGHFLSWVVVAGIAQNLLSSNGAINNLLTAVGAEKIDFLTNKSIFRWLLVFSDIWKESGWSTILYLAAIMGIDTSLYEAATVDGANRFQKMVHITWPGIAPTVIVLLTLAVGNIMEAGFQQVFTMYNPAVYSVADILDTYVYRITFQRASDFGFSTAVGLFKGVINMILLLTANFISKRLGYKSIV